MRGAAAALAVLLLLPGLQARAYPLNAYEETDIHRLEAYWLARDFLLDVGELVPGSLWTADKVRLRLLDQADLQLPAPDDEFTKQIRDVLGKDARYYGIAVLDVSEPSKPVYAELAGERPQNPASVGKIMVGLAFFQALADTHPKVEDRARLLKQTEIAATDFIERDTHKVPIWKPGDPKVLKRPIEIGDRANLYTYLDWMLSASSNAAASQLMSELMLLQAHGTDYPLPPEASRAYFADTPRKELNATLKDAMQGPIRRNGIDPSKLRQGKFFTRKGKSRVDGPGSVSTARELLRYLVLMEQGRLVDPWSSLQLKRYLYLTDNRIRYASSPALDTSAVYYKSGSLYSCKEEKGFTCGKYMGNKYNYMNSIAIVENDENGRDLHYIVVVLSNVLRKDSLEVHKDLAAKLHRLIESRHPVAPPAPPAPIGGQPAPDY